MSSKDKSSSSAVWSGIGKKLITGITGIGLALFVLVHLLGNLTLLAGSKTFNEYSHFLTSHGEFIYPAEIILLLFFLFHIIMGISVYLKKRKARPQNYEMYKSAGKPSKQTISSRTMILTGIILFIFLIIHLIQFKYGPTHMTNIDGQLVRNLHANVISVFANPWWVLFYVVVMVLLGYHLRHGFWSMLQSLGAMKPSMTPVIYTIGIIFAILIAVGFIILPIWIYFTGGVV
jgi:succinate dehydrogenase / fumarate reductase cytochrome b subunit